MDRLQPDHIVRDHYDREDELHDRRVQNDLDAEIARDLLHNAKRVWQRGYADLLDVEMPNGDKHIINFDGERWFIVNL